MQLRIPPWVLVAVNDVTASRVVDGTVYTNTTGKTLFVIISFDHTITLAGGAAYVLAESPVGTLIASTGPAVFPVSETYSTMTFMVRPDDTYKVVSYINSGTNAVIKWIEAY